MITTLISVALIIALILVVRRPFARAFGAKAAYALWALPLARLVLPPLPSWLSPLSIMGPAPEAAVAAPQILRVATPAEGAAAPADPAVGVAPDVLAPVVNTSASAVSSGLAWPSLEQAALALLAIVAAGALGIFLRQAYQQWVFARLVANDSEPVSHDLANMADRIQSRIGLNRHVPVRASLLCGGPLVTGIVRPVILVPAWFEADYSIEEQRIALTHEAMHVKRGDLLALQAAHIVAALQWFNPLAWRALDAFRADQEAACDADVLSLRGSSPRAYGATLLKAIRQSRSQSAPAFVAALPLNHAIKDRFAMLQHHDQPPAKRRVAFALTLLAGAALMIATSNSVAAHEPELDGATSQSTRVIVRSDLGDRQLVILTDPMAGLDAQLAELDNIEWPEPPIPPMSPMPPMDMSFLSDIAELEGLTAEIATAVAEAGLVHIDRDGNRMTIAIDTDRLENMEEELERRIEIHAEAIEANAEAWAAEFEAKIEAFELDTEALAERVEAITESTEFTAVIDAGVESARELQDACADEDLSEVDIAIVVSDQGDKAICVDGDRNRLTSDDIEAAVMSDPNLTDEEKQRFLEERHHTMHINIQRDVHRSVTRHEHRSRGED